MELRALRSNEIGVDEGGSATIQGGDESQQSKVEKLKVEFDAVLELRALRSYEIGVRRWLRHNPRRR